MGAAGFPVADLGDTVSQSLRFKEATNLDLERTQGTPTNQILFTFSAWVKRSGNLSSGNPTILYADSDSNNLGTLRFWDQGIRFYNLVSGSANASYGTRNSGSGTVYRDPAAWLHIVFIYDSANATASDRLRLHVNGARVSWSNDEYGSAPAQNQTTYLNTSGNDIHIGNYSGTTESLAGYMAEAYFIDGQAQDPTNFGKYNEDGVWVPIEYTGTHGNNGFHLTFDSSQANGIGHDSSGNGNHFTATNFDTAALSASNEDNDIDYLDTPTSNYGTLNPLQGTSDALIEANLSTQSLSSVTTADHYPVMEVSQNFLIEMFDQTPTAGIGNPGVVRLINQSTGDVRTVSPGLYSPNQIGIAVDIENRATYAYDITNDAWLNGSTGVTNANINSGNTQAQVTWTTAQLPTADRYLIRVTGNQGPTNTSANRYNFGQRPYIMPEPSGFVAVQTNNLTEPTIKNGKDHFDVVTYPGDTDNDTEITGLEFQPDLVWIKNIDNTGGDNVASHMLFDSVRGVETFLQSNGNWAEGTNTNGLKEFTSNGFRPGSMTRTNESGNNYVAWCWKAGGTAVSNTDGTITSSVSANTDAGFSIVEWERGTNTTATIGHGLNSAPEFIISKAAVQENWSVYHVGAGNTGRLRLNLSNAFDDTNGEQYWNDTDPGNDVFTVGNGINTNATNDMIAYCWHSVEGFSKFGSYEGNGSDDGPFIYTGFSTRYVLVKNVDNSGDWRIYDTERCSTNPNNLVLVADQSAEEFTTDDPLDLLSNGFKVRGDFSDINTSGDTYAYCCFAENPFGGENAAPATAR